MSLQAASNFLTTSFPQEEEIYTPSGATSVSGTISSGISATVIVSQAVKGEIGDLLSGVSTISHQTVKGEIGDSIREAVITNDIVSGEIDGALVGTVKTNILVNGEIGDSSSASNSQPHQTSKGEIGESIEGTVAFPHQTAVGEIGSLLRAIASTGGTVTTTGTIHLNISAKVVVNNIVAGEIGNSLRGVAINHVSTSGRIGSSLSEKVITNILIKGMIGDQLRGVVATGQKVSGSIGTTVEGAVTSHSFSAFGSIGTQVKETTITTTTLVSALIGVTLRGRRVKPIIRKLTLKVFTKRRSV